MGVVGLQLNQLLAKGSEREERDDVLWPWCCAQENGITEMYYAVFPDNEDHSTGVKHVKQQRP
jgi:hypothetical protein